MSEKPFDVLETMARLVGNTRTMAGLSGDPRMREALREGEKARDVVAELIEAARKATEMVMHDGTSSREACDRLDAAWRACVAANNH